MGRNDGTKRWDKTMGQNDEQNDGTKRWDISISQECVPTHCKVFSIKKENSAEMSNVCKLDCGDIHYDRH